MSDKTTRKAWETAPVQCVACGHRWQAVMPAGTRDLQCPKCGEMDGVRAAKSPLPAMLGAILCGGLGGAVARWGDPVAGALLGLALAVWVGRRVLP